MNIQLFLIGLSVVSSAFANNATIPQKYSGDGADLSPPIAISGVPAPAKSLAVYVEDPDAPRGTWYHWFLFNLPNSTRALPEGLPRTATLANGGVQGLNDFGQTGYNGPSPPAGKLHHYHFHVLALDAMLEAKPGIKKDQFLQLIKGHILSESILTGTFERK